MLAYFGDFADADNCLMNGFFTDNEIKMIVNKAHLLMLILIFFSYFFLKY